MRGLTRDWIGHLHSYYPAVGKALNCGMMYPDHAGVANAIGAVVGQVDPATRDGRRHRRGPVPRAS